MNNETIKRIFQNSDTSSKVIDIVVRKSPFGWGRRSVAPYFTEKHGLEMKQVLLGMISSNEDQIFEYEYFKKRFNLGKQSLYLRINQSMRYVCEFLDDESHTLSRFCSMITIHKEQAGVVLRMKPECRGESPMDFKPKAVISKEALPVWRETLDEYLAEAKVGDKPLFIDKLVLTTDEIREVKVSLSSLKGVMSNVNSYSIKVVIVNVEE